MMTHTHGVFDSAALSRQTQVLALEKQRDQARQYAEQILAQGRMLGPDATKLEAQLGRQLTHEEFERRAKKLVRSLWITQHPTNAAMRIMYLLRPDGKKDYISAYEKGLMPEYSLFEEVVEEVHDPAYLGPRAKVTSRKDLPKIVDFHLEVETDRNSPNYGDVRGPGFVFDDSQPRPGMIRRKIPGRELRRGWRTVAARLVWPKQLTSPELLEREFSAGERDSWTSAMGRGMIGKF